MNRKYVSRLSKTPNSPMGSDDLTLGRGHRQDYSSGPSVHCSGKVGWTDPGFRKRGRWSDGVLLQRIPPTIITDKGGACASRNILRIELFPPLNKSINKM